MTKSTLGPRSYAARTALITGIYSADEYFKTARTGPVGTGTKRNRAAYLEMERITAYLISVGIIAFGIAIVANAELRWGSVMFWLIVGAAPIAVGTASLANEIDNDRHV